MTLGDACDESAQAKPAEVVADLALSELCRVEAQQSLEERAKLFCLKPLGLDAELHENGIERLDAGIVNAQSGNPLITDEHRGG